MSLEQLGGGELSRSFLSLVERGRSRISLRALGIVAKRLDLPLRYFLEGEEDETVDDSPAGAEWFIHVRRVASNRVFIELRLDEQDLVGHIGLHIPEGLLHVDVTDGPFVGVVPGGEDVSAAAPGRLRRIDVR
jgi:transcriptional regulator with XRE-family HTH domain